METFKEADNPESIKSHSSKKLIWKFNFILFIAMMWAVCQAILTMELFFWTDQDLQSPWVDVSEHPFLPVAGPNLYHRVILRA